MNKQKARCPHCDCWHTPADESAIWWSKHPHGIELPAAICAACEPARVPAGEGRGDG